MVFCVAFCSSSMLCNKSRTHQKLEISELLGYIVSFGIIYLSIRAHYCISCVEYHWRLPHYSTNMILQYQVQIFEHCHALRTYAAVVFDVDKAIITQIRSIVNVWFGVKEKMKSQAANTIYSIVEKFKVESKHNKITSQRIGKYMLESMHVVHCQFWFHSSRSFLLSFAFQLN